MQTSQTNSQTFNAAFDYLNSIGCTDVDQLTEDQLKKFDQLMDDAFNKVLFG